jgi:hypothetical protein
MDFVMQLPKSRKGKDAMVVFVDRLTKMTHFEAIKTTATASEVAAVFINTVFRHHGLPTRIVSDRDTRFTSMFWKHVMQTLNVQLAMSTAFHPQTDGQTERANRTIEDMIRIYTSKQQDDWDELLPLLEFAYNNSVNQSTKMSPFYLDRGLHPKTPDVLNHNQILDDINPSAEDFLMRITNNIRMAQDALQDAQVRQAKYADQRRHFETLNVGDMVLLSAENLKIKPVNGRSRKLMPRFVGPYRISEVLSTVAYKLELPQDMKIHPVFHISLLKKYHANTRQTEDTDRFENIDIEADDEYEVEKIVDKKTINDKTHYLVRWKDYSEEFDSWEPEENVENCRNLVEEFETARGRADFGGGE